MQKKNAFVHGLMSWYQPDDRPLPWKGIDNAYYIWLSEIILQQTRVEQGLPYYEKFVRKYPTVELLAAAKEDAVLKDWEGLGYYSRARNLHAAAKEIADRHQGVFPDNYADIRALKGIGDYTAAAIASFAFKQPYAVVDGNVYRVLARYFGIHTAIDSSKGKKEFQLLANQLIDNTGPDTYNQAIMDFGATQCKPVHPACDSCPLQHNCYAVQQKQVEQLPYKAKKLKKKKRYFYYLILRDVQHIHIVKRTQKDIWKNLYEFPLIETKAPLDKATCEHQLLQLAEENAMLPPSYNLVGWSKLYKQTLSHQLIEAFFIEINIKNDLEVEGYLRIQTEALNNYAYPRIIRTFLDDNFNDKKKK